MAKSRVEVTATVIRTTLGEVGRVHPKLADIPKNLGGFLRVMPPRTTANRQMLLSILESSPMPVVWSSRHGHQPIGALRSLHLAEYLLSARDCIPLLCFDSRRLPVGMAKQAIAEYLFHPLCRQDKEAVVRTWQTAMRLYPSEVTELGLKDQSALAAALNISARTVRNYLS